MPQGFLHLVLKRMVLAGSFVPVTPLIALARIAAALGSEDLFVAFACLLSLVPGKLGSYLRLAYYKGTLVSVSSDVFIGFGTYFSKRGASLGSRVSIGAYGVLGDVAIGDGAQLASRVSVPSGRRQHAARFVVENPSDELIFDQISIGAGCWIGEGAIIMADVGERSIVSAGSVVARPMPGHRLIGGNPARIVRELPNATEIEK